MQKKIYSTEEKPESKGASKRILDITSKFNRNKVTHAFTEIFSDIHLEVRFAEPKAPKITELDEAYFHALKNWDRRKLYFEKSFYIIVISKNDDLKYEIFINSKAKYIKRDYFKETLIRIKAMQPDCKLYVGQNNPMGTVIPNKSETLRAQYLNRIASKLQVKIADQFIMSNTECFSFEENDYMNTFEESH